MNSRCVKGSKLGLNKEELDDKSKRSKVETKEKCLHVIEKW